jgi:hypothetical protein
MIVEAILPTGRRPSSQPLRSNTLQQGRARELQTVALRTPAIRWDVTRYSKCEQAKAASVGLLATGPLRTDEAPLKPRLDNARRQVSRIHID